VSSILLADDNPHAQRMGSQILSQEGHTVITVSDGDEAMLHLQENVPDLVMVDTRMPGPSGFDICKHIKSQPKFSAVKVVLLAGPLEPFDTAEAESAGPDGVLHKPLDAYTLIDTVNSLLGQVPETDQADAAAPKTASGDGGGPRAGAAQAEATPAGKPPRVDGPRISEPSRPQPEASPRPFAVPAMARTREAVPAAATATTITATATAPTATAPTVTAPAPTAQAKAAVSSRPATAVADLSDSLSNHFTAVVEQALGTEDAQQRQRQQVESIVREVLEEALPAIIERITGRVMATIEH
jgi:CheY-like chemotaxis protein